RQPPSSSPPSEPASCGRPPSGWGTHRFPTSPTWTWPGSHTSDGRQADNVSQNIEKARNSLMGHVSAGSWGEDLAVVDAAHDPYLALEPLGRGRRDVADRARQLGHQAKHQLGVLD